MARESWAAQAQFYSYIYLKSKLIFTHFISFIRFTRWMPNIIKIHQNPSKSIKIIQHPLTTIKFHQNQSNSPNITQNHININQNQPKSHVHASQSPAQA